MITIRRPRDLQPASGPPPTGRVSRSEKITVLLADDNAVMRQGLCTLLKAEGHFNVVGQAQNGREAVKMERTLRPDVILMDISMPVLNGLEATRQILAANPAAKVPVSYTHLDGVVIIFMDITAAKKVEAGLRVKNTDLTTHSAEQDLALNRAEGRLEVHDARQQLRNAKAKTMRKAAGTARKLRR